MTIKLAPDLQAFVDEQVRAGKYISPEAAVADAVQRLKVREERIACLRRELQPALDELDRGEGVEWDLDAMKAQLRAKYPNL